MPAARKTASRKRGAVARSEGKKKTIRFRGIDLTLPAKLPGEVLFAIDDQNVTGALRTILGDEETTRVRSKVSDLDLDETVAVLSELVGDIFEKYGLTTGE